jgi:hypothetical protein
MATAGSFILACNDGKQDRLITATNELSSRLTSVSSVAQTIPFVQLTHMFYMERSYSVNVAVGTEYFKATKKGTSQAFGSTVTFELQQLASFIHDCVVHVQFGAIGTPPVVTGNATQDAINLYNNRHLVNPANPLQQIKYRYTDFPGIKLFKSVKMKINTDILDEYKTDDVLFIHNTKVEPSRRLAWNTGMGQSPTISGTAFHRYSEVLEDKQIRVSAQCPRTYQPALDLWIPLLFWFSEDVGLSFPSSSVTNGQRYVEIDLCELSDIIQAVDVAAVTSNDAFNLAGNQSVPASTLYSTVGVTQPSSLPINKIELYMNNIFVRPEIEQAFQRSLSYSLIRVHKRQTMLLNVSQKEILLNQLVYPIETITFGFRPTANNSDFEKWHRFNTATSNTFRLISSEEGDPTTLPTPIDNIIGLTYQYFTSSPVIDNISVAMKGNFLYTNITPSFFNTYTTYARAVTSPSDQGVYLLSFAFNPKNYNPNGHFNISREREMTLNYESTVISRTNPTEFIASAKCIAFLLVTNGSMVLTFAT